MKSQFKLAIVSDEITQDLGRACEIVSCEFGLSWIELRSAWNKNVLKFDADEVAEARRLLQHYRLRVTDICSPLFKVDWPGAPPSEFSPKRDEFLADYTFAQQDEVLERSIELAKAFSTDRVRCFDFWRLADQAPYRDAMNQTLLDSANKAAKHGVVLCLENEYACNTATGAEAAKVLDAVRSRNLMLTWDPANAAARGENPYPDGYNLLPKDRISHCHTKDLLRKSNGTEYDWAPVGRGSIDWIGQFRALKNDGYKNAISLENHWRGAGTAEESTRQSWASMKETLKEAGVLNA
jgi:L-ribulose-5-phosphate 3-epimerase